MIKENIEAIEKRMADAAARAGRSDTVTLIAVTKNHPVECMKEAAADGIVNVGENRVQEAMEKIKEFPENHLVWHLIGHLQTNKAKQAVAHFDLIHSIDSEHLLKAVDKEAGKIGKVQDILPAGQCRLGKKANSAWKWKTSRASAHWQKELPHVRVCGLMCMATEF